VVVAPLNCIRSGWENFSSNFFQFDPFQNGQLQYKGQPGIGVASSSLIDVTKNTGPT
jgi:hypothetical protein